MARLITTNTGVTVNVADDKVERMLAAGGYRLPEDTPTDGVPRGNASTEEWAAYATGLGVEVPEGAKRDDIRMLVEAHRS